MHMALFYLLTKPKSFGYPQFTGGAPLFPFQVKRQILDTFLERAEDRSGPPGSRRNMGIGPTMLTDCRVTTEETMRWESLDIYA